MHKGMTNGYRDRAINRATMTLFELSAFTSAAGHLLPWKVNCDALTDEDWQCVAAMLGGVRSFRSVEGVPTGGDKFAKAMEPYITIGGELLIVDDVLTTGLSMERHRNGREAFGVVLFARGVCPDWVSPIWSLWPSPRHVAQPDPAWPGLK